MNKQSLSERDICSKFITPALKDAGWDDVTQIREEVSFTKGRIIVRGKLVTRGKAEMTEYFVPVEWFETRSLDDAVQEIGFFGNQNTVCKPTSKKWRTTVDRLKQIFGKWDAHGA